MTRLTPTKAARSHPSLRGSFLLPYYYNDLVMNICTNVIERKLPSMPLTLRFGRVQLVSAHFRSASSCAVKGTRNELQNICLV